MVVSRSLACSIPTGQSEERRPGREAQQDDAEIVVNRPTVILQRIEEAIEVVLADKAPQEFPLRVIRHPDVPGQRDQQEDQGTEHEASIPEKPQPPAG